MSVACVGPAWHAFERVGKDGGSLSLAPKFLPLSFQTVVTQAPSPGGYSHTLPIRVCAAQRGRDFEAPDLERGIHFTGVS